MNPSPAELVRRDLAVVWHPCTQMRDHETLPMVPIRSARGAWLHGHDGKRYLDAISSWWVNLFGHAHPRLDAALRDQIGTLEHVILAGFTHEPAIELAERLVAVAPKGLTRVQYADNGSSAVEIALKLAFHHCRNRGDAQRTRFVALAGGYHGETLGALSVTDIPLYRETYAPLLLTPLTAPSPDTTRAHPEETALDVAVRAADALDALLAEHGDRVCALIVEPLVQCAAGMRMHDPEYLRRARAACDRHGIVLIADEIAVGFGRTGTLFACEQAGIAPDLMCLSKGLSGGYLPLSAVLATEAIYQSFYDEYTRLRAFLHSHSYTGNALGCRVALEVLNVFRDEPVLERIRALALHLADALAPLRHHPQVRHLRQTGMIAAFDLVDADGRAFDWTERRGLRVVHHGLDRGVLLRPLGHTVYFMPPYCILPDEIDFMVDVAREGIELAIA
ncbi:MAG TPA: adenosylmethionine--8-amino-7-oxononanoate transaminase [Patescibacteria group bacterium]|nr:adenosylmethionine--8-amino-7-oxononanoate transaminase [Patescibacteria group bacterium]